MKTKRKFLQGALSAASARSARSKDVKVTLSTLVFQVTAGTQMTTQKILLAVYVAYSADAEIMWLMLMFHQAVALVVDIYFIEHETVEFHMYLLDQ